MIGFLENWKGLSNSGSHLKEVGRVQHAISYWCIWCGKVNYGCTPWKGVICLCVATILPAVPGYMNCVFFCFFAVYEVQWALLGTPSTLWSALHSAQLPVGPWMSCIVSHCGPTGVHSTVQHCTTFHFTAPNCTALLRMRGLKVKWFFCNWNYICCFRIS